MNTQALRPLRTGFQHHHHHGPTASLTSSPGSSASVAHSLQSMSNNFRESMDELVAYKRGELLRGRYRYVRFLQKGSFGNVTLAEDVVTGDKVAVKAMDRKSKDPSCRPGHEVSIMNRVGYHPNTCLLLDSFETARNYILILEYVAGGDLYDAVHKHTKLGLSFQEDPRQFARLCRQLVSVVEHAHSRGVYHLDIKPENVLLTETGDVKLCDWGLATRTIRCDHFDAGTRKYMPPEVYVREKHPKPRGTFNAVAADNWSIGVTLCFALLGSCPWRLPNVYDDIDFRQFKKSYTSFFYRRYPDLSFAGYDTIISFLGNGRPETRDAQKGLESLDNGILKGFTVSQECRLNETTMSASADEDEEVEDVDVAEDGYMEANDDMVDMDFSFDNSPESVDVSSHHVKTSPHENANIVGNEPDDLFNMYFEDGFDNGDDENYENETKNDENDEGEDENDEGEDEFDVSPRGQLFDEIPAGFSQLKLNSSPRNIEVPSTAESCQPWFGMSSSMSMATKYSSSGSLFDRPVLQPTSVDTTPGSVGYLTGSRRSSSKMLSLPCFIGDVQTDLKCEGKPVVPSKDRRLSRGSPIVRERRMSSWRMS